MREAQRRATGSSAAQYRGGSSAGVTVATLLSPPPFRKLLRGNLFSSHSPEQTVEAVRFGFLSYAPLLAAAPTPADVRLRQVRVENDGTKTRRPTVALTPSGTPATMALRAGLPTFTLARRLGSSVQMIEDTYGHVAHDSESRELERVEAFDAEANGRKVDALGRVH